MKHFKYNFILLIIVFFILPNDVNASSKLIIQCPDKGIINSSITCNLTGTSDKPISSLSAKISTKEDIEFISFTTNSIWEGNGDNGTIELYTDKNKTSPFEIGTITLKLGRTSNKIGTIIVSDIIYYDNNFKPINISDVSKNITIASNNNDLANLSIKGYDITPDFNKDITEYSAIVNDDQIIIEGIAEDSNATISGIGTKTLETGTNNFSIIVTSGAGTKKEYKLIVTKPNEETEGNPEEKPKDEENKEPDSNKTPENNQNYKDSTLKKLNIEGYNLDFNSEIYKYSILVNSNVNQLTIDAIATNSKATVTINGNENFIFGNNEIVITVTAEDGSKSKYIITVLKKSDSCIVKNITISGYELKFNCNTYDYELEIGFESSLNIEILTENEHSKVNIYNNDKLKHNDIINIVVKSADIDYKYNIKILKNNFELEELFNNNQLIFMGIVLIVTSGYIIVRRIYKKIKKNNTLFE